MGTKVLILGFGNPGRLDDGLGPALVKALEAHPLPNVTLEANYQLAIEDGAAVAAHDIVIFVDAAVEGAFADLENVVYTDGETIFLQLVTPRTEWSFSTHALTPMAVLGLAHHLFQAKTRGYLLGIRGYEFDAFAEQLSNRAERNLKKAVDLMLDILSSEKIDSLLDIHSLSTPERFSPALTNGQTASSARLEEGKISSVRTEGLKISSVRAEGQTISSVRTEGLKISSVCAEGLKISSVRAEGLKISSVRAEGLKISSVGAEGLKVYTAHVEGRKISSVPQTGSGSSM